MTDDACWTMIDDARRATHGDAERTAALLTERLTERPLPEIIAFHDFIWRQVGRAYDWNLWGAAYVINGGCTDDGFDYFRGWLIAQGREVFEAGLADPDNLAVLLGPGLPVGYAECEEMLSVALMAYERRTGAFPPLGAPAGPADGGDDTAGRPDSSGERWREEDLPRLFPRLCARVGWSEDV